MFDDSWIITQDEDIVVPFNWWCYYIGHKWSVNLDKVSRKKGNELNIKFRTWFEFHSVEKVVLVRDIFIMAHVICSRCKMDRAPNYDRDWKIIRSAVCDIHHILKDEVYE